jgi:hypothetical protein
LLLKPIALEFLLRAMLFAPTAELAIDPEILFEPIADVPTFPIFIAVIPESSTVLPTPIAAKDSPPKTVTALLATPTATLSIAPTVFAAPAFNVPYLFGLIRLPGWTPGVPLVLLPTPMIVARSPSCKLPVPIVTDESAESLTTFKLPKT